MWFNHCIEEASNARWQASLYASSPTRRARLTDAALVRGVRGPPGSSARRASSAPSHTTSPTPTHRPSPPPSQQRSF